MTEQTTDEAPIIKKITFNCPIELYNTLAIKKREGEYGTITRAILTALREKFQ